MIDIFLIRRAVFAPLIDVAITDNVNIKVKIGLRRKRGIANELFTADLVPAIGFVPIDEVFVLNDGQVGKLDAEIANKIFGNPKKIADLNKEQQSFINKLAPKLKTISEKYDVRLDCVISTFKREPIPYIVTSMTCVPTAQLEIQINNQKSEKTEETFDVIINNQKAVETISGKTQKITLWKGSSLIGFKTKDKEHPFLLKCSIEKDISLIFDILNNDEVFVRNKHYQSNRIEELQEAAKNNFDKRANDILGKFREIIRNPNVQSKPKPTDEYPPKVFSLENATDIKYTETRFDKNGNPTGIIISVSDKILGILDDDYKSFVKFYKELSNRAEIKVFATESGIVDKTLEWFRNNLSKSEKNGSFVEYLIQWKSVSLKKYKIWIPIQFLSIEKPLKIGHVSFNIFKKEFFKQIQTELEKASSLTPSEITNRISELENEYGGKVFGSYEIESTEDIAVEQAKTQVERSIMILQFFSPAAFDPTTHCYFNIKGRNAGVPSTEIFLFKDNELLPRINAAQDKIQSNYWNLTSDIYSSLRQGGLDRASEILRNPEPTELEELIVTSVSIYVHGVLSSSVLDKFVFTLSAIETLLLDNSEGIGNTVGLRLGFLSAATPGQRKEVSNNLKKAYEYRSKYLHHGKKDSDIQVLKTLQLNVWEAINTAIRLSENISTKKQLWELINQNIYS